MFVLQNTFYRQLEQFCILLFLVVGVVLTASLSAEGDIVKIVDLTKLSNGDPVPDGTVLSDQYRDIGVLFGARKEADPILQDSADIDPISIHEIYGDPIDRGFLFYNPDLYGAVGILHFVQPGTDLPASVSSFHGIADSIFGAFGNEQIEFVAFDENGLQVATHVDSGSLGPWASVGIESTVPFSALEIRTFGDPGIGIGNLSIVFVPEPQVILMLASAIVCVLGIRRCR